MLRLSRSHRRPCETRASCVVGEWLQGLGTVTGPQTSLPSIVTDEQGLLDVRTCSLPRCPVVVPVSVMPLAC